MSPAETKEWVILIKALLFDYGPWGLVALILLTVGFLWRKGIIGFKKSADVPAQPQPQPEKKLRKENSSGSNRRVERQWVTSSCPLAPDIVRVEKQCAALVVETRGLRDEQIRGNGWLELLASYLIFNSQSGGSEDIKERHAKETQQKILERMRESQREAERLASEEN